MCFHSRQTKTAIEVENRFKAKITNEVLFKASGDFNGFTYTQKCPLLLIEKYNIIDSYNWGVIPAWAKDESIKQYTLNAKIGNTK